MNIDNSAVFDLLGQVRSGSETAMKQIYRAHSRSIYAFALSRLRDPSKAEEIVVDTMWEVWKRPDSFRGESSFSTWVLGIARHKMLDAMRARGPQSVELDEGIPDESPTALEHVFEAEQRQRVKHCIEGLPSDQRECLMLTLYENLSIAELAQLQKIPENTVKTRLFHARLKIKNCLKSLREG